MKKNTGNAMVGVIIIVLILIIGGYFLYKNTIKSKINSQKSEQIDVLNSGASGRGQDDNNKDLSNIESDLNSINLEGIDASI